MPRARQKSGRPRTVGGNLPLSDHVSRLYAGDGRLSRMERFEAHHRAGDPLDEAMILLENVVQVFDLPDLDCATVAGEFQDHVDRMQTSQIGSVANSSLTGDR